MTWCTPSSTARSSTSHRPSGYWALRANLARLRELDNHLGGTDTLPLYEPEVERIATLVRSGTFSATTRQDLQLVLAEYAQQTGWAAFDAGLQAKVRQHFETSFEIAKDARSTELAGNALALRSYQLLSAGTIAPELTDRSLATITTETHPAVRARCYSNAAPGRMRSPGDAQRSFTVPSARFPRWNPRCLATTTATPETKRSTSLRWPTRTSMPAKSSTWP
jgi:hypothetical protein